MIDAKPAPDDDNEDNEDAALPSRSSSGELVAGILGTLDAALTNRPRPVAQIEERYREPWASADGVTVEGLDEPVEHNEPDDTSGAQL